MGMRSGRDVMRNHRMRPRYFVSPMNVASDVVERVARLHELQEAVALRLQDALLLRAELGRGDALVTRVRGARHLLELQAREAGGGARERGGRQLAALLVPVRRAQRLQ